MYKTTTESTILLLMEEILQQLIWRISYYLHDFDVSQVVAWDFWTINSIDISDR